MNQAKISITDYNKEKNTLECNFDSSHTFIINSLR